MNYIIVNNTVVDFLNNSYESYCEEYGYPAAFDSYMQDMFSFNGAYKLLNQCLNGGIYVLIGKNCRIQLERYKKCPNCLWAKKVVFFQENTKYLSDLAQTLDLPGQWNVITSSEAGSADFYHTTDIQGFLSCIKPSYHEFYDFEKKWKTWDLYNSKLREAEERQECETESDVTSIILENNVFAIQLKKWIPQYKEGVPVSVLLSEETRYQQLGSIVSTDINRQEIKICCENHDFVKKYIHNKLKKIIKVKIIDFGTLTRLKRQQTAMKKLFHEETANKDLKNIIMGEHTFIAPKENAYTMNDAYGLFGSNIRQKEAYLGALNTQDIYLIQGPPGTGKTTIITEIVKQAISKGLKVLVSSETNIAVDNVLERVQYMENVVPVRLGREDRIEKECVSFLPDKISASILDASRNQIISLDKNGINLHNLLEECKTGWSGKIQHVDKEIHKLLPPDFLEYDHEQLYYSIDNYENLIIESNKMYEEIIEEQRKYYILKDRLTDVQRRKNEIEALIETACSAIMKSGLKEADAPLSGNMIRHKNALKQVNEQLNQIEHELAANTYEIKKGSYQRRLRKIIREKEKLENIANPGSSFLAALHTMKNILSDVLILKEQKRHYENALVEEIKEIQADYLHKLELWNKSRDIRSQWLEVIEDTETKNVIEHIYMEKTNVVFATCMGIGASENGNFSDMEYDYVIIDEAAKCNMLDLLLPLILGKKIILVGDHKQLYPMLETEHIKNEMTLEQLNLLKDHILFKWLYEERVPEDCKIMLNRQYRMQYDISQFISSNFYGNELICEKEKSHDKVMMWIDSEGAKEVQIGTSYENDMEAEIILQLVKKLDKEYQSDVKVGIICTYKVQAEKIRKMIHGIELCHIDVECSTVDAFQGKEKHTIIFNLVRSERKLKFISEESRVNVAVSRAQECLYVVGNAKLAKSREAGILEKLYTYIKLHGEILNGRYVR